MPEEPDSEIIDLLLCDFKSSHVWARQFRKMFLNGLSYWISTRRTALMGSNSFRLCKTRAYFSKPSHRDPQNVRIHPSCVRNCRNHKGRGESKCSSSRTWSVLQRKASLWSSERYYSHRPEHGGSFCAQGAQTCVTCKISLGRCDMWLTAAGQRAEKGFYWRNSQSICCEMS